MSKNARARPQKKQRFKSPVQSDQYHAFINSSYTPEETINTKNTLLAGSDLPQDYSYNENLDQKPIPKPLKAKAKKLFKAYHLEIILFLLGGILIPLSSWLVSSIYNLKSDVSNIVIRIDTLKETIDEIEIDSVKKEIFSLQLDSIKKDFEYQSSLNINEIDKRIDDLEKQIYILLNLD